VTGAAAHLGTAARTRRDAADLLRETVGVVPRGALVAGSGPDDRSSAQGIQNSQEDGMANVQQGGRVALITGASRGIGAGVARLLASRGMRTFVNYRSSHDKADDLWGQRQMTEVLAEAVTWALTQPSVFRISAVCDVENIGSARVLEKAVM
jgi:hypothetical protein